MKYFFIPLIIIVLTALVFGYFGYHVKSQVNIPLVVANITALSAFISQLRFKKTA